MSAIRRHVTDAESLLDVACGTGLHLAHLRDALRVEGVEPHPRLRAIALDRLDGVPVHDGDMRTFELDRRFDVVTCLFSAIGYMVTIGDLRAAIRQMATHLSPGGLLVVEPWFHPDAWIDGLVMAESATTPGMAIARLSHSTRDDHIAHFDFYWSVGLGPTLSSDSEAGGPTSPHDTRRPVDQWIEPHRLALWTDAQYRDAFERARLDVHHDRDGLIGRGFYLGYKAAA